MRSFARARSSSRRAPPIAASNPCSSIASSSVVVCSWLRDARGPVCSTTRPLSIDSCDARDDEPLAELGDAPVAELDHLGEVVAGVDVHDREREPPGRNAFSASRSSTIESLPPEKSSTGRSRSAATSRMMWIASASSSSRCESVSVSSRVAHAGTPRELARAARRRATRAATRPSVSSRSSGASGSSYGSETPVNSPSSPRNALARTAPSTSRRAHSSSDVAT